MHTPMQTPTTQTQTNDAISHATPNTTTTATHNTTSHISHATPNTTTATHNTTSHISHATMQTMQSVDYDFENDDNAFYDFIEFGIASNGGRLSIR